MDDSRQLKQTVSTVLSRTDGVLAAYLFGSQADGSASVASDTDIALLVEDQAADGFGLGEVVDLELRLGGALRNHNLDVVLLNRAPLPFQHRVLATGTLLYSRDDQARRDFEERVVREFLDFQPWLKALQREYLAALQERYPAGQAGSPVPMAEGETDG